MTWNLKNISILIGLIATLGGAGYHGVVKYQQIGENTADIRMVEAKDKLDKLCALHRKALADWFHWKAECEKTQNTDACRLAEEAKRRVDRLEKQIQKLEEETGETCS